MNTFTRSLVPVASTVVVAVVAAGVVGCAADEIVEPELGESEFVEDGVRVTLEVVPDRLQRPGEVEAVLTYENLGNETVVVTSSWGCLSFATVYRGEDPVPFPAAQEACTTAVTHWDLPPDEPLIKRWPLAVGGESGFHAPAGSYRFVAKLLTHTRELESAFTIE